MSFDKETKDIIRKRKKNKKNLIKQIRYDNSIEYYNTLSIFLISILTGGLFVVVYALYKLNKDNN